MSTGPAIERPRPQAALTGGIRFEPDLTLGSISPKDCAVLILPGGSARDVGQNMKAGQPEYFNALIQVTNA